MGFRGEEMTSPTALITGATRGLGAELARRFWSDGYSLILIASNEQRLLQLKNEFGSSGNQFLQILRCDLSLDEDRRAACNRILETTEKLEVLINNAAIHGPIGPVKRNDFALWQKAIEVNLIAPAYLCNALLPLMERADRASIVNLSGGGATSARPNFSAYAAAKSALVRFTETLAVELADTGIRANSVAPGAMPTELLREVLKAGQEDAGAREISSVEKIFEKNENALDQVIELITFLASSRSRHINGRLISAVWDDWPSWEAHAGELKDSDLYTLRRITGRDRGLNWGDKNG